MESSNLLYDNQIGFRKNPSITPAIITLIESVSKERDGKIVVGVYLDI